MKEAQCTNFTVVCKTRKKDANGERIPNFYRVTAWNATGEVCAKYLHKGDKVSVLGDLILQEYVDKQGVTRAALQVTASEVEFMTPRPKAQADGAPAQEAPADEFLPF